MKTLRATLAVSILVLIALAQPVGATSASTDQSDLWWNPSESGWGIQLVQRGTVIFATMFVYDTSGNPTWYTATLQSTGQLIWSGSLYLTHGPWFGAGSFNPALVGNRIVGTMQWDGRQVYSGVLNYTVDGVFVVKNVQRQLLVYDDFSGVYKGALALTVTGCSDPSGNVSGQVFQNMTVTQSGQSLSISIVSATTGATITIVGSLTQGGQFGRLSGTYSSSVGETGTAYLIEMNVQYNTFSARLDLDSNNNSCQNAGYISGIRVRS